MGTTRNARVKREANKAKAPGTIGRPPLLTEKTADRIFDHMANGKSLNKACKLVGVNVSTVLRRVEKDPSFCELYVRAQHAKAETQFEELVDIADEGNLPTKKDPFAGGGTERARLRVQARQWAITKGFAKKYGDKVELDHKGGIKVIQVDEDDANA